MSRYHVIDAPEGRGHLEARHNAKGFPSSPRSPSPLTPTTPVSPRLEHYSTGRGDPSFPDVDMHLGMIFGTNSGTGVKCAASESNRLKTDEYREKIKMRLKFLEDSNTVMQSRNQNLITENKALSTQLEAEVKTVKKLELQLEETRIELEKEVSCKNKKSMSCSQESRKDQIISTAGLIQTMERSVQCWAVCLACQRKLEGQEDASEPTVAITKSELESLENDMQSLRDAVVAREEAWDRAMEREQNYRQQLARLSAEVVTTRHLSDSRHSELEGLAVALTEKEAELKATQKDLLSLKKIILKFDRRQRDLEENFDLGNAETSLNPMSEREQKTVEEIVRRQNSNAKSKLHSRTKGTSSMPQSAQGSPRFNRTAKEARAAAGGSLSF